MQQPTRDAQTVFSSCLEKLGIISPPCCESSCWRCPVWVTCLLEAEHETDAGPCGIIPSPAVSIHSLGKSKHRAPASPKGNPTEKWVQANSLRNKAPLSELNTALCPCLDSLHQDMIPIATETGKSERQTQTFDFPTKRQEDEQREAARLLTLYSKRWGDVPAHAVLVTVRVYTAV